MKRLFSLSLLLHFINTSASAQYATTGTGNLRNQIWWFDWAGFAITEGASRTFLTNNGLTVTIKFSNVTAHEPQPSVMNTWSGAILHLLYDFTDPAIQPALYDGPLGTATCSFAMSVTATRDGAPVNFSLITADAEASAFGEVTTLQTSGENWQTIDFFRNSSQTDNPITGCGTQTVGIVDTYGGFSQTGQNPVLLTRAAATTPLQVNVKMDHGGTTGGMGLAFGILEAVDRGDLPLSYGTAQHQLLYNISNSCSYQPPFPSIDQVETLKIGAVAGDPDPIQYTDDNAIGVDEEGVNVFPVYDGSGTYSINVNTGNTTGSNAYLTGWFDYNRNGAFDNGESVTAVIPANTPSVILSWTGLPTYLPKGTVAGYGFRFRISSDQPATQHATGNARDGEVEDYFVNSVDLCAPMTVSTRPDTSVCAGQPVPLSATGGVQYSWSTTVGLSDASIANPVATPGVTTTYTVTGSTPQGCQASASLTIAVLPGPIVTKSDDTTICQGKTVNLLAGGGTSYAWSSSDNPVNAIGSALTVSPVNTTRYYVLVTGSNGCSSRDSITVNVHPIPVFSVFPPYAAICKNDSILLTAGGGDLYSWSSGAGGFAGLGPTLKAEPAETESYQVQITDNICQLTGTLNVRVVVKDLPTVGISKSNDIDCTLGQALLQASGGVSYLWDSAAGIQNLTSYNPVVTPLQTTVYHVKVTDSKGCSAKDSITVGVDFTADPSHYPIPSAFTPNNDGRNDCWGLKYWGHVTSLDMEVFNRWGQRVFFTNNPADCWDGNYKGTAQPAGAYVYQIRATTTCGVAYRKGTVLLIR
ncbi:MAG TPA: CshA/CshB family fibrillar adhesin-related protein [Puia sp.]|nr:CshA/CshB family fibrillar adhesin-related protein [Puia sp.]